VHPRPGERAGEWRFQFTPRRAGTYRIFADFTPAATAQGLYASIDLAVGGATSAAPAEAPALNAWQEARDGYRYVLRPAQTPVRVRQVVDLTFTVTRDDGGPVPLETVMGAYAHLVAFDAARSGFAHLHPIAVDPLAKPDAVRPTLEFKLTIPRAGRYVIWAQLNLGGQPEFVPFWFDVVE
jgi:hypothetical protein